MWSTKLLGHTFVDHITWTLCLCIYIFFPFRTIYIFFPYYLHFSGIQENEPEFIDLSDLTNTGGDELMREAFLLVGFADDSAGKYKLRPCPLGTFVDSSRTDPTCKNCSAGKLDIFFLFGQNIISLALTCTCYNRGNVSCFLQ